MRHRPGNELAPREHREPSTLRRWCHELFFLVGNMIGFSVPTPPWRDASQREGRPATGQRRFAPHILACFADAPSVEIETRRAPSAPPRRMSIRTVVDEDGRVYARPQQGSSEYWYRRILINPGVLLHAGSEVVSARATRVADANTNALVTELYLRKYGSDHPATSPVPDKHSETAAVRFEPV